VTKLWTGQAWIQGSIPVSIHTGYVTHPAMHTENSSPGIKRPGHEGDLYQVPSLRMHGAMPTPHTSS
jgi:hypothetical protein